MSYEVTGHWRVRTPRASLQGHWPQLLRDLPGLHGDLQRGLPQAVGDRWPLPLQLTQQTHGEQQFHVDFCGREIQIISFHIQVDTSFFMASKFRHSYM